MGVRRSDKTIASPEDCEFVCGDDVNEGATRGSSSKASNGYPTVNEEINPRIGGSRKGELEHQRCDERKKQNTRRKRG